MHTFSANVLHTGDDDGLISNAKLVRWSQTQTTTSLSLPSVFCRHPLSDQKPCDVLLYNTKEQ
jgi:hypothetical protein